jgi:hypothetical protein
MRLTTPSIYSQHIENTYHLERIEFVNWRDVTPCFRKIDEFQDKIQILGDRHFTICQSFDNANFERRPIFFRVVLPIAESWRGRTIGSFEKLGYFRKDISVAGAILLRCGAIFLGSDAVLFGRHNRLGKMGTSLFCLFVETL